MANDSTLVGVGKPKVGGAISVAPIGTTLPTDATTELSDAFKRLGYVSEDGVTISEERDSEDTKAWGGDIVYTSQTSYKESVAFMPIELNPDVCMLEYGDDNVTVEDGKVTVLHTSASMPEKFLVIETVPNSRVVARYAAPRAKLTEKGDINLNDSDPIGRELTFTLMPDDSGVTMYEYLAITGLTGTVAEQVRAAVGGKTVSELESYAAENGIDLSGARTKADKVAAIAEAIENE